MEIGYLKHHFIGSFLFLSTCCWPWPWKLKFYSPESKTSWAREIWRVIVWTTRKKQTYKKKVRLVQIGGPLNFPPWPTTTWRRCHFNPLVFLNSMSICWQCGMLSKWFILNGDIVVMTFFCCNWIWFYYTQLVVIIKLMVDGRWQCDIVFDLQFVGENLVKITKLFLCNWFKRQKFGHE